MAGTAVSQAQASILKDAQRGWPSQAMTLPGVSGAHGSGANFVAITGWAEELFENSAISSSLLPKP